MRLISGGRLYAGTKGIKIMMGLTLFLPGGRGLEEFFAPFTKNIFRMTPGLGDF